MDRQFEILINEHRAMMLNYASTLLQGDRHVAEDIVQDSCLVAYKILERFESEKGSFSSWLRGIIRNKVMEFQRKRARRSLVEQSALIEGMEEIYQLFDEPGMDNGWKDRIDVTRECVQELNQKMRGMVMQFYHMGRSLREISQAESSNVMAVGQRLSRARKLIRVCVQRKIEREML